MTTAVIYQWKVREGDEAKFREAWVRGTEVVSEHTNASGGSRLHRMGGGWYLAYARWPTLAARDEIFGNQPPALKKAIEDMQACVIDHKDEIVLEITDDLLVPEPDLPSAFHEN